MEMSEEEMWRHLINSLDVQDLPEGAEEVMGHVLKMSFDIYLIVPSQMGEENAVLMLQTRNRMKYIGEMTTQKAKEYLERRRRS